MEGERGREIGNMCLYDNRTLSHGIILKNESPEENSGIKQSSCDHRVYPPDHTGYLQSEEGLQWLHVSPWLWHHDLPLCSKVR